MLKGTRQKNDKRWILRWKTADKFTVENGIHLERYTCFLSHTYEEKDVV